MVKEKKAGIVNDTCIHQFDLRDVVLKKYKHICQYCGVKGNTIDHVVPRSKGGKTELENLVCACDNCNKEKGNLYLEYFLNIKNVLLGVEGNEEN
ncbi:HNH endonuclease [Priestia megaterium]|uniref:HNH endonuclease n=1 Tax=Priestia megaterium TaxID=1404 RepID=UPI00390CD048